jgi:hypothetical protein
MTPPIERIRYYDGEYLRAFDFAAEQGYHVDMRRRLNMALHLSGIGVGLQLTPSISSAVVSQVFITPGMGIDEFGREIYLPAPYTFDDQADLAVNRLPLSGIYYCYVWIKYQRLAETPPATGYAVCNSNGQTTRWRESYKVVLKQASAYTKAPATASMPAVTDDISEDDPDPDASNGVFLGVVKVDPTSLTGVFSIDSSQPQPPLTYVGVCAQRVLPPNFPDTTSTPFNITSDANAFARPIGVDVQSNLFADQNLIVGKNFPVTLPSGPKPPAAGNVKVAGDLFLQGDLYLPPPAGSPNWQTLADFIRGQTPDILVGVIPVTPAPSGESGDAFKFTVTSTRLKQIGPVNATASIAGIQLNQASKVTSILGPTGSLQVQVISVSAQVNASNKAACDVTVNWSVSPTTPAPAPFASPIQALWVSYVVVCYPPS